VWCGRVQKAIKWSKKSKEEVFTFFLVPTRVSKQGNMLSTIDLGFVSFPK